MLSEEQRRSIVLSFKLTPAMAKTFELLLTTPVATNRMIHDLVDTPAKITIYRLRAQLQGSTITIHKRNRVGYWLDLATKQHILRTLESNLKHVNLSAEQSQMEAAE
jgi:hypothetical protein